MSRGFVAGTKVEAFDNLNSSKDWEETEAHKEELQFPSIQALEKDMDHWSFTSRRMQEGVE